MIANVNTIIVDLQAEPISSDLSEVILNSFHLFIKN